MPLRMGQVIHDRYRIEILLGRGGMGAVYGAIDLVTNASLALKENQRHTPESQRQFNREAGLLRQLDHPNLPRVAECFLVPGQGQYLVMDYIAGDDLNEIIVRRGALPEALALDWIGQVLEALAFLHGRSIIHRDVKPANVKVTPEGRVYLVDFGLAKVYDPSQETTIGARGVTPGYAPPEQYGPGRTDARSDLYSGGATLYAMVTGQRPPDAVELMMGRSELLPPRQLQPALSVRVEDTILRAMQPRPRDRPQTAVEFGHALGLCLQVAPPEPPVQVGAEPAQPETQPAAAQPPPVPDAPTVITPAPKEGAEPVQPETKLAAAQPPPVPDAPAVITPAPKEEETPPAHIPATVPAEIAPAPLDTAPGPLPAPAPAEPTFDGRARQAGTDPADYHPLEPEMILVPAVLFLMGTSDGQLLALPDHFDWAADYGAGLAGSPFQWERPHHAVALPAFEIARHPVTNAQYAAYIQATGRRAPKHWGGAACPAELAQHPVVHVNWREARDWAAWLAKETGHAYRLPTEAEWERAARGDDLRLWPWGDAWDPQRVNWSPTGQGSTSAVGQFSPAGDSPFGCAGMAGNVFEWCSSQHKKYPYRASDGRERTRGRKQRIIRGGAWSVPNPGYLRCAARVAADPRHRFEAVGFRLARTVEP